MDAGQRCRRKINRRLRGRTWFTADPSGRSLAGIVGSNPAGGMDVSRECCALSGSLCVGLITRQ